MRQTGDLTHPGFSLEMKEMKYSVSFALEFMLSLAGNVNSQDNGVLRFSAISLFQVGSM